MVICLKRGAHDLHMVQLMLMPLQYDSLRENPDWFYLSGASFAEVVLERRPLNSLIVKFMTCFDNTDTTKQ